MPKNLVLDAGHSEWVKKDNPLETEVAKLFCAKIQKIAQADVAAGTGDIATVMVPLRITGTDSNSALNAKMRWMNENIVKYGNPDITFSIHCNWSNNNKTAVGWNIFYRDVDSATDKPRAEASKKLANSIGSALDVGGFKSFGTGVLPDTLTAVGRLGVCTYIKAPSCLIELGFLSSQSDKDNLLNDKYLDDMAQACYKGIKTYFA